MAAVTPAPRPPAKTHAPPSGLSSRPFERVAQEAHDGLLESARMSLSLMIEHRLPMERVLPAIEHRMREIETRLIDEHGDDGRRAYRAALDRVRVQLAREARLDPDEVGAINT
jgi:hypothetical protein